MRAMNLSGTGGTGLDLSSHVRSKSAGQVVCYPVLGNGTSVIDETL
jgi:hypothetical protein